jgi:hypothetical protein
MTHRSHATDGVGGRERVDRRDDERLATERDSERIAVDSLDAAVDGLVGR